MTPSYTVAAYALCLPISLALTAYAVLFWRLKPYAAVADRLAALPNREVARQVVAALARPRGFVGRRLAVAECEARRLIEAEEAADANGATATERHDDV